MDMCDRRVDDRGLGGAAYLREVWQERRKVLLWSSRIIGCAKEILRTRKRLFKVSLRALSTALCVARRSAVLARRLGLRLLALLLAAPFEGAGAAAVAAASAGGGRASVWGLEGEEGVWGPLVPSVEAGEPAAAGDAGMVIGRAIGYVCCVKWGYRGGGGGEISGPFWRDMGEV